MVIDQAEQLRRRMSDYLSNKKERQPEAEVLGVVSGKGGVGKSVFCVNFSLSLARYQKKSLIIDLDIGMGNIEHLLNQPPKYSISEWLCGDVSFSDVITRAPGDIQFVSGGSGLADLFSINEAYLNKFIRTIEQLKNRYDFIIFDFGAGISQDSLHFMLAVHRLILVTTPEPPALADAYSAVKMIHSTKRVLPILCVINQVMRRGEGREAWQRLSSTAERFIGTKITWLNELHADQAVSRSVREQVPVILRYPAARFSIDMKLLCQTFLNANQMQKEKLGFSAFINHLKKYFRPKGR